MSVMAKERGVTRTGGREATTAHIPGDFALAVGMPPSPVAPDGWNWVALRDVARLESGHTPSRKRPEYWDGDIPWIGIRDARAHHGGIIRDTDQNTNELGIQNSSARVLPPETVCLSRTASVGYVVIMGREMATSQDFVNWTCSDRLDPHFLKYLLLAEKDALLRFGSGAVHKTIYYPQVKAFHICLPTIAKQKRIVAILDEAFAAIDVAAANSEKNLVNAREVFESHLDAVFSQKGEGWLEASLISLCELFVDSAHRTPKYEDDGFPALRPRDVVNGVLSLSDAKRVSREEYETQSKRHKPCPGDIVYSRELSYGWAAVLPESPRVCLSQGMCLFRPTDALDTTLFLYILNGPVGREQAADAAVGTAHPHINLSEIKAYRIPVPPRAEQGALVEQLDWTAATMRQLEFLYTRKISLLAELKKSILQQAFAGELTADVAADSAELIGAAADE